MNNLMMMIMVELQLLMEMWQLDLKVVTLGALLPRPNTHDFSDSVDLVEENKEKIILDPELQKVHRDIGSR